MEYRLGAVIDARLKEQRLDLIAGIRAILEDWAARGFDQLPGPAIGQITDFCLTAMDTTVDAALDVFAGKRHNALQPTDAAHLGTELLTYLEGRLNSIAQTALSYADSGTSATQRFQHKQSVLLAKARRAVEAA